MSKPGEPTERVGPDEQIKIFLDVYRDAKPAVIARLTARVRELSLTFTEDELVLLAALDTPARVQEFLNTQVYYNNDHASPDMEETAIPPRLVLQTGLAHCFEGALFAYAVNYLHGHNPRLVLLEASQDSDHNLVIFQDPHTGLHGCNAHSRYPRLDGRAAEYSTIRAMAESYYPYYYSDRTSNTNDLTLIGYSDPFDLVSKFGVAWMAFSEPLWDVYYTYVDDAITFHYLFDDSNESHLYQLLRALKDKWIQFDAAGRPFVSVESLPTEAQSVWHAFWRVYDSSDPRPRGEAREIELRFMRLTGTTPIDLNDNAEDLQYFLERGYRIEQLMRVAF
jgi:hypothetical protein